MDRPGLPLPSCAQGTGCLTTDLRLSGRAAKQSRRATFPDCHPQPRGQPSSRARLLQARRTAWEGVVPGSGSRSGAADCEPRRREASAGSADAGFTSDTCGCGRGGAGRSPPHTPRLSEDPCWSEGERRGASCLAACIVRAEPTTLVALVPSSAPHVAATCPLAGETKTTIPEHTRTVPKLLLQGSSEMDSLLLAMVITGRYPC